MSDFTTEELVKIEFELEESQRLRGWIANSYANVEFMLGDLIVRCRQFPIYDALTKTMPHDATKRIRRVRQILEIDGALSPYAAGLEDLLANFELRHETRNLLAHGFATYHITPEGDAGLTFEKWHRDSDRMDARLVRTFRLVDLAREQADFVQLARRSLSLFYSIHTSLGWAK
ncbi:MAG: hypothetical protein ABIR77_00775 [Sphingomicrobium sp.]